MSKRFTSKRKKKQKAKLLTQSKAMTSMDCLKFKIPPSEAGFWTVEKRNADGFATQILDLRTVAN